MVFWRYSEHKKVFEIASLAGCADSALSPQYRDFGHVTEYIGSIFGDSRTKPTIEPNKKLWSCYAMNLQCNPNRSALSAERSAFAELNVVAPQKYRNANPNCFSFFIYIRKRTRSKPVIIGSRPLSASTSGPSSSVQGPFRFDLSTELEFTWERRQDFQKKIINS